MTLAIASDLIATLEREEFREALERLCVSEWHAADAFVEAYTASGPPGALVNLPLYHALVYLGRARRDLSNRMPELAEFMLDQALRLVSH